MRLAIRHSTRYDFDEPPARGLQRLRLKPKSSHGQQIIDWEMNLEGARLEAEYDDHHNNRTALVSVDPGATSVIVSCHGLVETSDMAGMSGMHKGNMPLWGFGAQTHLTKPGPLMRALVTRHKDHGGVLQTLHSLSRSVLDAVAYEAGHTDAETPAELAMAAGRGVCQDHAHIFIGCSRALGIPARYVSGYLMMDERTDQEASHGWAEAHVDGLGWVAFDVSNGIAADERYVRVATGCDYSQAAPITGLSYGAGASALAVRVEVRQQLAEQ
jgi:transglutaminase-like putative cysteine protease